MATQRAGGPLQTYHAKRRFDATPEPKGRVKGRTKGAAERRYAIQKHDARRLHYDLRLELDGVLKSWAITRGPSLDPADKRLAVQTEDHPLDYATFEGNIPQGNYGAGAVLLWDEGSWVPRGDPHEGLKKGKLDFEIRGERLTGRWTLVRFKGSKPGDGKNWLLIKQDDGEADTRQDVTSEFETSVASGRSIEQIAGGAANKKESENASGNTGAPKPRSRSKGGTGRLPDFVEPALATLVEDVPESGNWLFEIKFDGYRALAAASGGKARIFTRSGLDWTDKFRSIADALGDLGMDGVLLDGEVVAVDNEGRSSFGALQQALSDGGGRNLSYFVFDLLAEGGRSIRDKPLRERKERLQALLKGAGGKGPVIYTDHVSRNGAAMLETLCNSGYEGIIAKRADAPYRSGRGRSWLKIKCGREQEFVIVGWSSSDKKRPFASLLLGVHENGALRYVGRVGTGFSQDEQQRIRDKLDRLSRKTPPVQGDLPRAATRDAHWVTPKLVAQVAFAEFTADGLVRQGRFLGLREDKPATEVRREKPASG